jgi:hypothetical protein
MMADTLAGMIEDPSRPAGYGSLIVEITSSRSRTKSFALTSKKHGPWVLPLDALGGSRFPVDALELD